MEMKYIKGNTFSKDPLLKASSWMHSPHNMIPRLIKKQEPLILDVGCNTCFLGETILKERNAIIDGIDINQEALERAEKHYRRVYQRDLYCHILNVAMEKYDYIIFSDLLEHLPRPDLLLKDSKKYLKNNGRIIIPLPNIGRLELRLKHLFGNFEYAPGIMSGDHLRFFTRKSAIAMIEKCGYEIENVYPTGLGDILKFFSTLTAFQFIYVCKKNIESEN